MKALIRHMIEIPQIIVMGFAMVIAGFAYLPLAVYHYTYSEHTTFTEAFYCIAEDQQWRHKI